MHEHSDDVTLTVARLAALYCSMAAIGYVVTRSEPQPIVAVFLTFTAVIAVVLWLENDARRTGVGAVQNWGSFLLLAWPAVIPWYAFKTRGPSGWRLLVGLGSLIAAPYISWTAAAYALWIF